MSSPVIPTRWEAPAVEGPFVGTEDNFTEVLIVKLPSYGNDMAKVKLAAEAARHLKVALGQDVEVYRTVPLKDGGCAAVGDPVEPPTWDRVE